MKKSTAWAIVANNKLFGSPVELYLNKSDAVSDLLWFDKERKARVVKVVINIERSQS
jgi:hypothetical protein